jgi:uncharacterized membrane protein
MIPGRQNNLGLYIFRDLFMLLFTIKMMISSLFCKKIFRAADIYTVMENQKDSKSKSVVEQS